MIFSFVSDHLQLPVTRARTRTKICGSCFLFLSFLCFKIIMNTVIIIQMLNLVAHKVRTDVCLLCLPSDEKRKARIIINASVPLRRNQSN